jgi:hypothetical protein
VDSLVERPPMTNGSRGIEGVLNLLPPHRSTHGIAHTGRLQEDMHWDESSREPERNVIKSGSGNVSETQEPGWNVFDDAVHTEAARN